jgi:site-specific DNA-methyltransferase (adenine-specific)
MADGSQEKHIQSKLSEDEVESPSHQSKIQLLAPRDVFETLETLDRNDIYPDSIMLDPWYNRGEGSIMDEDEYFDFLSELLEKSYELSDQIFLWGYPDMIWKVIPNLSEDMELIEWLTWYYKNRPSVDKGWRSSQFACLHLGSPNAELHPEHFLTEEQKQKKKEGTLRYMPGPPSVIEASLPIGFVKQDEQTDHPSQKPKDAIKPLVKMSTTERDLVLDPMAGSGTTGSVAEELGRDCILADESEEYTKMMEDRLSINRLEDLD